MKNIRKFSIIFAASSIVIGTAIGFICTNSIPLIGQAQKDYEIIFNKATNAIKGLPAYDEKAQEQLQPAYKRFDVTTKYGTEGLPFFIERGYSYQDNIFAIGQKSKFGNFYSNKHPYHGRIDGLKEIVVNYSGAQLTCSYSYEAQMENGSYVKTSIPLTSGVAYNFDNNFPQYFSIETDVFGMCFVKDIKLVYSCNQDSQAEPLNYRDGGYHVGALIQDQLFERQVNSHLEAQLALEEAIVRHYQFVSLDYTFDATVEECYQQIFARNNLTHMDIYAYSLDPEHTNIHNYIIAYAGDTLFNNDFINYEENDPNFDFEENGYENHFDVASAYTLPTLDNTATPINNVKSMMRLKYAKDHNLMRPADFNDFAVDQLDESKCLDVYNSEDLWWSLEKGYKPRFPLLNCEAEWIYNQAKDVLRHIIYDGMSKYEKIRAIYEWIVDNNQYDYDALESSRAPVENMCYFLEGVFERGIAVCDAFSKTLVTLGKIEGLDVIRGAGYNANSGHAWGYFRENDTDEYHLICPTWGDQIQYDYQNNRISFIDYEAFMAPSTYFRDASNAEVDFLDLVTEGKPIASTRYKSTYALDKIPGQSEYDYAVDSNAELEAIFKACYEVSPNQSFVVGLYFNDLNVMDNMENAFIKAGYSLDNFKLTTFPCVYDTCAFILFADSYEGA